MQSYIERIRGLREDNDLTQSQIASVLGTSQTMYARYERGANELPLRHLITLCQFYNVSADYFYFETDKPLVEDNTIIITDAFTKELEQCTDLEKQQLMEMLKILRMKPVAV